MKILKKIALLSFLVPAALLLEAASVFAAVSYSRTPAGADGSSLTLHVQISDPENDFDTPGAAYVRSEYDTLDNVYYGTSCVPVADVVSGTDFPIAPPLDGEPLTQIAIFAFDASNTLCDPGTALTNLVLEGDGVSPIFTFTSPPSSVPHFAVPTGLTAQLSQNTSDQLSNEGTLKLIALVVGIPLAFFVMEQLIGLIPRSSDLHKRSTARLKALSESFDRDFPNA